MMQPGEYCYVINMELEVKGRSAKASISHRGTLPVDEGETRLDVTNYLIDLSKQLIQEQLSKIGGNVDDSNPSIIFLSIEPN